MIALIVILVIVAVLVVTGAALLGRRYRLHRRFGPEYDRAVAEQHGRLRAEAELSSRQRRVRKLDIKPLTEESKRRYCAEWTATQERFVDAPQAAVMQAHSLVTTIMTERGYPDADDEHATADLSVHHAETVGHLRAAQQITRRVTENGQYGDSDTEALRQALIHYRALFTDLLGDPAGAGDGPGSAGLPAAGQLAAGQLAAGQLAAGLPAADGSAEYSQPAASRMTAGRHAAGSSRR